MKKDISKKIYVSITGRYEKEWRDKLAEIKKYKITEVALFLEYYARALRKKIYKALEESSIKKIPLVHIRNDMDASELKYLCKKYNNPYLTIHEDSFRYINKWKKYKKHLYLEMNYDNMVSKNVKVKDIGGFCVDLSHFKAAEEEWSEEFKYTLKRRGINKLFACNHINGYCYKKNCDVHTVKKLSDFKYLNTLPAFVFGDIIAIETFNSIKDQLKFKKHLIKILNKTLNKK